MIKLSRRYDEVQNDNFWGYAKQRVYGSMLDFLRSLDTVSRSNRKIVKQIEYETDKYYNEHGHEPDENYLAATINEDIEKIREAKVAAEVSVALPINEQITIFSGSDTEAIVEQDELLEVVEDVLSSLKEREQMIIQLYYFEELNLKEISEILDITESRISQIHKKVIQKIREKMSVH
jgi:RNA polymerase sigma factor for flagellar operon FliA